LSKREMGCGMRDVWMGRCRRLSLRQGLRMSRVCACRLRFHFSSAAPNALRQCGDVQRRHALVGATGRLMSPSDLKTAGQRFPAVLSTKSDYGRRLLRSKLHKDGPANLRSPLRRRVNPTPIFQTIYISPLSPHSPFLSPSRAARNQYHAVTPRTVLWRPWL